MEIRRIEPINSIPKDKKQLWSEHLPKRKDRKRRNLKEPVDIVEISDEAREKLKINQA